MATDYQRLTAKDISNLMGVSLTTAKSYINDIKETYDIHVVMMHHFKLYFSIST